MPCLFSSAVAETPWNFLKKLLRKQQGLVFKCPLFGSFCSTNPDPGEYFI